MQTSQQAEQGKQQKNSQDIWAGTNTWYIHMLTPDT